VIPRAPLHGTRPGRALPTLLLGVVLLACGCTIGYLLADRFPRTGTKADAGAPRPDGPPAERVGALARLQPAGGVIPVFGPPGDRIAKLLPLAPGQQLAAGQPVAELESREARLAEVRVAELQLTEAKTARSAAERAGREKIRAAETELAQAKANKTSDLAALKAKADAVRVSADAAAKAVARLKELQAKGVAVAAEDAERAELLKAQADAELAATTALGEKTRVGYEEAEKAAAARIAAASAELEEALARVPLASTDEKVKLARQLAERTVLKAPVAGTVLKVIGREGQPTGLEPVLQLADLSAMTAVAEVYESDVARVAEWARAGGASAEVTNPALPRALKGTVRGEADISRTIARNQVFAVGPREDADRRVVEVVIHLDAADAPLAGRLVGLQVTVALAPR
jgi:HlyD family secretion protein